MATDEPSEGLEPFFRSGITAEDLPGLFLLRRAWPMLKAFITLFRGGEDEVVIRLLVLREIGARADTPRWTPQQLRAHFSYLDEVKFETVLHRLRDNGLLLWDGEVGDYQISPAGRMALAALATLLKFSDEGAELGYVTAQLAASQLAGAVTTEELQHLLSRLNELQHEFNRAVVSGSEHRIQRAEEKLNKVWKWVEKGTEVIRTIAADAELDRPAYAVAQRIGQAQSRMLRMGAVFQRALNQLHRQQVHLGASGLSSADIARWLRMKSPADLAALLDGAYSPVPRPLFMLEDIALDVAEWELVERERPDAADETLPPALSAPHASDFLSGEEDLTVLAEWLDDLRAITGEAAIEEHVPAVNYLVSAYRMSLLTLLGDPESQALEGPVAELARSELQVAFTDETVAVGRHGVAEMTRGQLTRRGKTD
jgi:hypothetical protein